MPAAQLPKVVILCGGRGTRLRTGAQSLPKPLVEIGGMPVVWHVVMIYASYGFTRFELLTGHRASEVRPSPTQSSGRRVLPFVVSILGRTLQPEVA